MPHLFESHFLLVLSGESGETAVAVGQSTSEPEHLATSPILVPQTPSTFRAASEAITPETPSSTLPPTVVVPPTVDENGNLIKDFLQDTEFMEYSFED